MARNQAAPAGMNVNSVCDLAHHRHDGNGHSKDGRVRGTIVIAEGEQRGSVTRRGSVTSCVIAGKQGLRKDTMKQCVYTVMTSQRVAFRGP